MSMMMRRSMMVPKAPGGLPAEYLAVQYLESTGTQWIDTNVVPNVSTWARLKFTSLDQTGDVIFGFYNAERTSWRLLSGGGGNYLDLPSGNNTYRYSTSVETCIKKDNLIELEVGNKFKRIIRNDGYSPLINTEFISTPIEAFVTVSKSLTLNYCNDNKVSLNRWYYVKIYEGNVLIRDMIPCIRISDSKPGMYDLVGRQFYTNAGTGEFIAGWTLLPEQDGRVEKAKLPLYSGAHIHMEWDNTKLSDRAADTVISFHKQINTWNIMNPNPAASGYLIVSGSINTTIYRGGYIDFDVPADVNLLVGYWEDSDTSDRRITGDYVNIQIS